MWIITVVILLAGGLLGAANLIIAKKPNAKDLIEKLTPYQGWIGVVLVLWGIWDLVGVLRSLGTFSVFWLVWLVTAVTELGLGFLLGYGLISKYVLGSSPQALEKGQQLRARLANYQGPLGVVAIGLAIIFAVLTVIR